MRIPVLLFFLFPIGLLAQENIISGVVKDEVTGEPLVGATIQVEGRMAGTTTDLDGKFSLKVSSGENIQISYLGYTSQVFKITTQHNIIVRLVENTKILNDVVVVGFGRQKKVSVTGAVGMATSKELASRPVVDATQALQGLIPGLEITKDNGSMEKSASIKIRGIGTIGDGASASPLILIDGVEGDINLLNPQDIENISVLKDAAASAIYGSRAPYGVILVTTKSGKKGKTQVTYNNNFRWSSPVSVPQMLDSYSYAIYFNEAKGNVIQDNSVVFSEQTLENMKAYQQGLISGPYLSSGASWASGGDINSTAYGNTDWYDVIYKDYSFSQEHNISVSGGQDKVDYYFSLNYLDQGGLLKIAEERMARYSVNGKIGIKVNDWTDLKYSSRFIRRDYSKPSAFDDGLYENLARWGFGQPNKSLHDNNGYLAGFAFYYPQAIMERGVSNAVTDNNYQQVTLTLEPVKNWVTTGDVNYRISSYDTYKYYLAMTLHDINGDEYDGGYDSSVSESSTKENYFDANVRTQYHFSLADAHNISLLTGFQVEELRQKYSSATGYGIVNEKSPQINGTTNTAHDGTEKIREGYGSAASWATMGWFSRINYDYLGRYLFEVSSRFDGSSMFRNENRWVFNPSFSLGWNIAQEEFWKSLLNTVNLLKVRISYGSLGNQNINNWYQTYRTITLNTASGGWMQNNSLTNTASMGAPVSTSLTWETVSSLNGGLDWALFGNRLTGSLDIYKRTTSNMIGPAQDLPDVYGQSQPKYNNTSLETKGFELEMSWRDRLDNGLEYGVKATLADSRTFITDYPNTTNSLGWDYGRWGTAYRTGGELGELWGYETTGIARTDDEMQQHLANTDQSAFGSIWAAGDIMYKDQDENHKIDTGDGTLENHGDLVVIGNNTPRFQFGIDLNASWKGFDMRAYFQGIGKRDYWTNSGYFWGAAAGQTWSTGFEEHLDYFRSENSSSAEYFGVNTDSYFPRPSFDESGVVGRNRQPQTRYVLNAAYIRLKNLQFGYRLPQKLTQKAGISQCRIYVSGENLWTGTRMPRMFDPETISGGGSGSADDWRKRYNGNAYPLSTVLSMGMSVTL